MTHDYFAIAKVLVDIEVELRQLRLWESQTPSVTALSSTAPFAIDTLTFPQWLQFIFVPRLRGLVEARAPLPQSCQVTSMAEQYFSTSNVHCVSLNKCLQKMDALLTQVDC